MERIKECIEGLQKDLKGWQDALLSLKNRAIEAKVENVFAEEELTMIAEDIVRAKSMIQTLTFAISVLEKMTVENFENIINNMMHEEIYSGYWYKSVATTLLEGLCGEKQ